MRAANLVAVSLRARLIAGLMVLAAIGLTALAGVTYAEQRSFLLQRIDQQASSGVAFMSRALNYCQPAFEAHAPCAGFFGGGGFHGAVVTFPAGTFGQRRSLIGTPLESIAIMRRIATPSLPAHIPLNQPITVGARGGSGVEFRVLAKAAFELPGTTTVIAIPLTEVDQTLHRLFLVEALVVVGVLGALAALAWWLAGLGLRPLKRIADTAGAIAGGDLSQRVSPAHRRTEIGRLRLALNTMLRQVEQAFQARTVSENRLRRFIADASHELRTPLTAIRGYSELFRLGVVRDPKNVSSSMRRIEMEARRMTELVENLLSLARLDEAPSLLREGVDLTQLVSEAAQRARASAPDRDITVEAKGPVIVAGDPVQLHQVMANLVNNALAHTPSGTPVELRVSHGGETATVEIRTDATLLCQHEVEAHVSCWAHPDPD